MSKLISFLLFTTVFVSCSSAPTSGVAQTVEERTDSDAEILEQTLEHASPTGRKVLEVSRDMIARRDIVVGGCWHYINAVYNKSGFSGKERTNPFKGKFAGPYTETSSIQPGDWLYFVNHTYNDIEHSAIFITWIDEEKKEALMVNYVGGNKKTPGTYKRFVLDKVYNIIRGE